MAEKPTDIITRVDLHPSDFEIDSNKKLRTVVQRGRYYGEWLRGFTSGTRAATATSHRYCVIQDGWGTIHLDFMRLTKDGRQVDSYRGGDLIMRLPSNCPTPVELIEVQLYDGGQVWIDGGSRDVKIKREHGVLNTRYIVNLSGFFNGT